MLALDSSGRVCLKATPPIRRTKVVPEPWRTTILVRGWRRLTGRTNPPKPPKDERLMHLLATGAAMAWNGACVSSSP